MPALGIEIGDVHGLLIASAELFAGALEIVTRRRKRVERIDCFRRFRFKNELRTMGMTAYVRPGDP
ncbi:hypothetical protein RA307_22040 [Xanthobacteraceae bacterium Astr-EGSB]|uniref:hypothetical protein n=1 Tax=Astrobacterium formosum TaxID=3069710 RepID=UPI0027B1730C|nr:hypothetical protein [Xanthobacteraceae bacterium Astr-EGSB]